MATKVVATATVKALKGRKFTPTKAALTLVSANKPSDEKNCIMKTQFIFIF